MDEQAASEAEKIKRTFFLREREAIELLVEHLLSTRPSRFLVVTFSAHESRIGSC